MERSMIGHFFPGLGFLLIGLWHLFNHTKLHFQNPKSFSMQAWFPAPKARYLELLLIMMGSSYYMSTELFRHHRFDPDGTIRSSYLRNFEHASIAITYILYTSFSILLDLLAPKAKYGLTQLLAAVALGQQLLMFRLHSTDHHGLEGQYHLFLQILTLVAMASTLMGIGFPKSFMLAFTRSISLLFLGAWLMTTGVMLWTQAFIPKGCSLVWDDGHREVHCHDKAALHRAKALINIEFSWFVIAVMVFSVSFYLFLADVYGEKAKNNTLLTSSWGKKEEKVRLNVDDQNEVDGLGLGGL